MSTPTPENGRPSSAKAPSRPGASDSSQGSTGSHREKPNSSISDILRGGPNLPRPTLADDVAAHLLNPPAALPPPAGNALALPENTDDSPTVITPSNGSAPKALPPPPYVVGEVPSVAGRKLGHFELIEAVGSGGMAAVLKARDLELGRVVALKILPPESAHDPENVTRFKQEARAAARLDHDNVARVYFCGEDQGLHFIAFEFVEGVTLRQMIDRRGPLPAGECVRYMIQVAAGLNHAAERGVVHRDIKPSNILITPDGRAKIVDMGLARHLDTASVNGGVTQSGVTLGTFDYISPEQALDPRRADVRSDIYSLGCAFYHALTGRPPVPEGTAAKKLHAHQHAHPIDPRQLNPAVPDELAAVLARMMAKDPERRYQTPTDLIAHLKGVAERLQLVLDLPSDSAVHAVRADQSVLPVVPRLPLSWIIAAAAVAVAIAAIGLSGAETGSAGARRPDEFARSLVAPPPPTTKDPTPPTGAPAPGPQPQPDSNAIVAVETAEELAQTLTTAKDGDTTRIRLAAGTYDLTRLPGRIGFSGKQLELTGPESGIARVVVQAHATANTPGGLVLRADSVTLHGLWFNVAQPPGATGPAAGVAVIAGKLTLSDCAFLPTTTPGNREVAAIAVSVPPGEAADRPAPTVKVERCVFGRAGIGLRAAYPVGSTGFTLDVDDSGFACTAAAIQVRPTATLFEQEPVAPATVRLSRSSFVLNTLAAAVEIGPEAAPRITAGYCVFSPGGAVEPTVPLLPFDTRGVVVRVRGDKPDPVRFETIIVPREAAPQKNAYYRVDPIAADIRSYPFEDVKNLAMARFEDATRVELRQRPWDSAEGGTLAPLTTDEPWRAFRLRVTGKSLDPDLFVAHGAAPRVIGAQFSLSANPLEKAGRAYKGDGPTTVYKGVEAWPPADPGRAAAKPLKVWRPGADEADLVPGTGEYKDLPTLLRAARNGDTILIRADGPVPVEPVEIKPPRSGPDRGGEFKLTFKPAPGCRPVLQFHEETRDLDAILFRVKEGEITFEGVEFAIRPAKPKVHDSVSAVTLVGGRGCTFRDCVFTLDEEDGRVAAVVTLTDPTREMRMDAVGGRPVPKVRFENCLIRGRGEGVRVPESRPFELELTNSISAIYGPLVWARSASKDPGGAVRSVCRLTRVTALIGGPVVELHAGRVGEMRATGLVPLEVVADGCLFAAVNGAGRSVVELDGVDPADVKRGEDRSPLFWQAKAANRYANFDDPPRVVTINTGGDLIREWDWNQWIAFTGEVVKPVGKATFEAGTIGVRDLVTLRPDGVRVTSVDFAPDLPDAKPADAGADVATVARPAGAPGG